MNTESKKHNNAKASATDTKEATANDRNAPPSPTDDRPKRDDDDLSALLQTSDPEASSRGKPDETKR